MSLSASDELTTTTGSGGGLTVRDPSLRERARQLRYCGIGRSAFQAMHSDAGQASRWWEQDIVKVSGRLAASDLYDAIGLGEQREIRTVVDHEQGLTVASGISQQPCPL